MPLRVSPPEVAQILGGTWDAQQLQAFIVTASLWVDLFLDGECATATTESLEEIELYLAAHLANHERNAPRLASATRGDVSESYQAGGPDFTSYIKTAAALDPCGIVGEHWMGIPRFRWKVGTGYRQL